MHIKVSVKSELFRRACGYATFLSNTIYILDICVYVYMGNKQRSHISALSLYCVKFISFVTAHTRYALPCILPNWLSSRHCCHSPLHPTPSIWAQLVEAQSACGAAILRVFVIVFDVRLLQFMLAWGNLNKLNLFCGLHWHWHWSVMRHTLTRYKAIVGGRKGVLFERSVMAHYLTYFFWPFCGYNCKLTMVNC